MILECQRCGGQYEPKPFANWIAFCPHCRGYYMIMSECGFGPVVPCRIYLGSEIIGMVTQMENHIYRYDSDWLNVHKELENTYQSALGEAANLTKKLLLSE